jgi:hypothetical protein
MESRFLLNVVIREGPAILELLAGEDETLLIRGDAFLVLDLAFNVINRVAGLDFEGDCREILDQTTYSTMRTYSSCQ